MDIPKLSYEKNEGLKEPSTAKSYMSRQVPEETFANNATSAEGYQKPMPEVEVIRIFVISGGTKREPDYFKLLQKNKSLRRILVVVRSKKGQGLSPLQMSRMANKFYMEQLFETEDGNVYQFFNTDSIYLLTDLDEFGSELCELIKNAPIQYEWIVSNPCFEIWLYYHYFNSPKPHLDEGLKIDLSKRSQWMKQKLHELHPVDSAKALLDMQTAIKNSKANYQMASDGLPCVYSTQIHYFAEFLLDAMGKDTFESMIKQQHDKAEHYRKKQQSNS